MITVETFHPNVPANKVGKQFNKRRKGVLKRLTALLRTSFLNFWTFTNLKRETAILPSDSTNFPPKIISSPRNVNQAVFQNVKFFKFQKVKLRKYLAHVLPAKVYPEPERKFLIVRKLKSIEKLRANWKPKELNEKGKPKISPKFYLTL